eukprot:Hpha_TRINITY_DN17755_c0_g1::TRINITY_DN17755_c0_g1_i1::g.46387::m.46387
MCSCGQVQRGFRLTCQCPQRYFCHQITQRDGIVSFKNPVKLEGNCTPVVVVEAELDTSRLYHVCSLSAPIAFRRSETGWSHGTPLPPLSVSVLLFNLYLLRFTIEEQ